MHRHARSGVKHLDSTEHLKGEGVPATRIMCRRARYAEGIAVALAVCIIAASVDASDPELTAGFAAPGKPNAVDGNYFTFKGFRDFAAEQGSFGFSKANPEVFPALQGLGVSFTILEYYPNTTDPVHTHPRGTELLYVISGTLEVGLVDTNATLYTQTLQQGDVFVFPKGLLHYHVNLSQDVARSIAAYSSSDPGTLPLTKALFASGLPSVALELAFKVPASVINQLQAPWQEDTIVTTTEASTSSCSSYSW